MNTIVLPKAQAFRYLGLAIGIIFMIMSVRVYVNNYLTIQNSIKQTQQEIIDTQNQTDFIRNFELPYLQTPLAQRNLLHHQKIPQKGGKLIIITYKSTTTEGQSVADTKQGNNEISHEGRANFIKYQRRRSTQ